jgi:hypothetical protein
MVVVKPDADRRHCAPAKRINPETVADFRVDLQCLAMSRSGEAIT